MKPKTEVLGGSHKVALPPFFLTKPSTDDKEVTDSFDTGFNYDDLEAILDGFVEVIYVLLAEFRVLS